MRIPLIGLGFLLLAGCTESAPDKPRIDAADPGTRPYPNLGAFPAVPARVPASKIEAEQKALADQRDAARAFDARLRAIDPILDPAARPPEAPNLSTVGTAAPVPVPASPPVAAPVAAPPVATPAPAPAAIPVVQPAPVPAAPIRPARQASAPPQKPAAIASGTAARNAWIVGDIDFADGSALLSREARRTLREAVVAAQDRGGRVRVTPSAGPGLSPPEQALSPRRAAAAGGELEALGLDRARILIDPGAMRSARVAVEF
ncbi:MAG: hypothetical protein HY059_18020 [Proteobacteria bacterium]|nr:hypothetical protein [Pseudomonadota bacterium]